MAKIEVTSNNITATAKEVMIGEIINIPINEEYNLENGTYLFTFVANDGYKITGGTYGNDFELLGDIVEGKNFEVQLDINMSYYFFDIKVMADQDTNISSFNHLYLVDNNILKLLAKEYFTLIIVQPGMEFKIDLGQFIINIVELPFSLPSDILGLDDNIILADQHLNVTAKTIKADEIKINLGSITVPYKYHNSLDFMDTDVKLYLPYIEPIILNNEYVIGQTIDIEYIIDLYSGTSTVNIKSSKTNKVIDTRFFRLGRNIPFTTSYYRVMNNLSDVNGVSNNIDTAYIEVIRNKQPELNTFNNVVEIEGILSNESGFITVNEIELKTNATLQEKNDIINLLKNGVYIK